MSTIILDALGVQQMASGHLGLNLSAKVDWDDFPEFAKSILRQCNGTVLDKTESVDIRMWHVKIGDVAIRLVYDDYPLMVSMESSDSAGDRMLQELYVKFESAKPK